MLGFRGPLATDQKLEEVVYFLQLYQPNKNNGKNLTRTNE